MAPKLPPPANTKAVFAGPAWLDTDKPRALPARLRTATRRSDAIIAAENGAAPSTLVVGGGSIRAPDAAQRAALAAWCAADPGSICLTASGSRLCGAPPKRRCAASGTRLSPLDERLLDHEMARLAVVAFGKTARLKHLAQLFQHGRAAAHHDPIALDIQRRLADIVKQLL